MGQAGYHPLPDGNMAETFRDGGRPAMAAKPPRGCISTARADGASAWWVPGTAHRRASQEIGPSAEHPGRGRYRQLGVPCAICWPKAWRLAGWTARALRRGDGRVRRPHARGHRLPWISRFRLAGRHSVDLPRWSMLVPRRLFSYRRTPGRENPAASTCSAVRPHRIIFTAILA